MYVTQELSMVRLSGLTILIINLYFQGIKSVDFTKIDLLTLHLYLGFLHIHFQHP